MNSIYETLAHLYGEEIIGVSLKSRDGRFENHTVKWKDAEQFLKYKDNHDVYFSFTPLKDPTQGRKIVNASTSWCFGVDIDDAPIPAELFPQIVWESSPNKFQGVYIVDHAMDTDTTFFQSYTQFPDPIAYSIPNFNAQWGVKDMITVGPRGTDITYANPPDSNAIGY